MRKWIALLVVLLVVWMLGSTWYWLCRVQNLCCEPENPSLSQSSGTSTATRPESSAETSDVGLMNDSADENSVVLSAGDADTAIASNESGEELENQASEPSNNMGVSPTNIESDGSMASASNSDSRLADINSSENNQADHTADNFQSDNMIADADADGVVTAAGLGINNLPITLVADGLPAMTTELGGKLDQMAVAILAQQADQPSDVSVTGYFSSTETNATEFANLGLARADWLAAQLAERGVDREDVLLLYGTHDAPSADQDTNAAGEATLSTLIEMALVPIAVATAVGSAGDGASEAQVNDSGPSAELLKPISVRFGLNQSFFNLSADDRAALIQRIQYVRAHPNYQLETIGHTDSSGRRSSNIALGLKRAKNVADTLASFGLDRSRIAARSEGPDSPVADNSTPEGRAENRRVDIQLIAAP